MPPPPVATPTCVGAPSTFPDLPEAVMFKKRRLFRAIGLRNALLTAFAMYVGFEIVRRAPWDSPLFCAVVLGAYLIYYYTVPAKKTNVYYGASWHTSVKIKNKIIRPLPGSSSSASSASDALPIAPTGPHSEFISRTLATVPTLQGRGYKPTFYLESPSVQSIYATALRADPLVFYDRELVTHLYTDGEVCILDWSFSAVANDGRTSVSSPDTPATLQQKRQQGLLSKPAPVVVLFHGLTGGSDDANMHYVTRILNDSGFHVVIPVRRGCADAANLISRNKHYPYADEADAALAVDYIAKKMEGHWLMGVGLSAGSNVLAMYLGNQGAKSKLKAGVVIANGYCWNTGTRAIVEGNAFWCTLMSSMVQYNLLRRHDTGVFFAEGGGNMKGDGQHHPSTTAAVAAAADEEKARKSSAAANKKKNGRNSTSAPATCVGDDCNVVESHDLDEIRKVASSPTTNNTNSTSRKDFATAAARADVVPQLPPPQQRKSASTSEHPFVEALIQSSAAAKRLVARTVTHTQLAATYLMVAENENARDRNDDDMLLFDNYQSDDDDDSNGSDDDEEEDEGQTKTPFPYPFEKSSPASAGPPASKKRRVTQQQQQQHSASPNGGQPQSRQRQQHVSSTAKVINTLYNDYTAFNPSTYSHIKSNTTTSSAAVMGVNTKQNNKVSSSSAAAVSAAVPPPLSVAAKEEKAFNMAIRSGLRGRLNAELCAEMPIAMSLATAAAVTDGVAQQYNYNNNNTSTSSADALRETIAAPLQALKAHHGRVEKKVYERCADEVILKEHYAHIRDYDECVSRRIHGFHDLRSFYNAQSSRYVIPKITVPTFFMNAIDDPVASSDVIGYREIATNPNACLITTARGGHLGWADGLWPFPTTYRTWLERFILEVAVSVRSEVEAGKL